MSFFEYFLQACISWNSHWVVFFPRKKLFLKTENVNGNVWYKWYVCLKDLRSRLLDILIFQMKWRWYAIFCKPLVEESFVKKFQACGMIKANSLKSSFQGIINLRNNFFLLARQDHTHSRHDSQSKILFSQFNYPCCSSRKKFAGRHLFWILR